MALTFHSILVVAAPDANFLADRVMLFAVSGCSDVKVIKQRTSFLRGNFEARLGDKPGTSSPEVINAVSYAYQLHIIMYIYIYTYSK